MENWKKKSILFKTTGIYIFLVLVIFLSYKDGLNNELLNWDTDRYVTYNPHIQALTWENLYWMLTAFSVSNWHPLTWLSHAIDYHLYGLEPWGHHVSNLVIHSINTMLVFILTIFLLSLHRYRSFSMNYIDNQYLLAATVAATLFAIHPQHVEPVIWVAERKELLCLLFILLTLLSYFFYVVKHNNRLWYWLALLCFALALLSKPMAVTLPAILLLLDVYPLHRTRLTNHSLNSDGYRIFLEKIPFFLLTALSIVLTLTAQADKAIVGWQAISLDIRLLNAANSVTFYISKLLVPLNLSPFYPLITAEGKFYEHYNVIASIGMIFLVTLTSFLLWRKGKYHWLIAWLVYLIALSPVIGIIQVGNQAAADRYAYFPTIPFYCLFGIFFAKMYAMSEKNKILQLTILILFISISNKLVHFTQQQVAIWQNDLTFWYYIAAYTPPHPTVEMNLANAYLDRGFYREAITHFKQATTLEFRSQSYYNLAMLYLKLGKLEESLQAYQKVIDDDIDINRSKDIVYYNIGFIHFQQGRLVQARQALEQALILNPSDKDTLALLQRINKESR